MVQTTSLELDWIIFRPSGGWKPPNVTPSHGSSTCVAGPIFWPMEETSFSRVCQRNQPGRLLVRSTKPQWNGAFWAYHKFSSVENRCLTHYTERNQQLWAIGHLWSWWSAAPPRSWRSIPSWGSCRSSLGWQSWYAGHGFPDKLLMKITIKQKNFEHPTRKGLSEIEKFARERSNAMFHKSQMRHGNLQSHTLWDNSWQLGSMLLPISHINPSSVAMLYPHNE